MQETQAHVFTEPALLEVARSIAASEAVAENAEKPKSASSTTEAPTVAASDAVAEKSKSTSSTEAATVAASAAVAEKPKSISSTTEAATDDSAASVNTPLPALLSETEVQAVDYITHR